MALTKEQQRQLLLKMANDAVAKGVSEDVIDSKLKAFNERIEAGENIFAPVLERAQEISAARKTFNNPAPWTPEVVDEMNAVPRSPDLRQVTSRSSDVPLPSSMQSPSEASGAAGSPGVGRSLASGFQNLLSQGGRAVLGANAALWGAIPGDIGRKGQEGAFTDMQRLKEAEEARTVLPTTVAEKAASIGGSLLGGFASGGLGAAAIGQDVIDAGGTTEQAQKAVAINLAAQEAALATGFMGTGLLSRAASQVPASVATGVASRAGLNEVVPEQLKQDVFSPEAIAADVGGGAFGSLFPTPNSAKAASKSIRTGDPAIDAGIAATEQIMGKGASEAPKQQKLYEGTEKPFEQTFEVPRVDYSQQPKARVNVEPYLDEAARQDQISAAWREKEGAKRSDIEKAYAQKQAQDAVLYQELPGVPPVEENLGSAGVEVPRGVNLDNTQLATLRDQLASKQPEPTPVVEQAPADPTVSFAKDDRNTVNAPVWRRGTTVKDLEQIQTEVMSPKASKFTVKGNPSWSWNPDESVVQTTNSTSGRKVKEKVTASKDLNAKLDELSQKPLFSRFNVAATEPVAPRDWNELSKSPSIASTQERAALKATGDAVRNAGNAYAVAEMIKGTKARNPDRAVTSDLFDRFLSNPVTSDLLKKLKVSVVNPEDLAKSTDPNIQALGPGKDGKGITFGMYHPSIGVAVIGEGFKKAYTGDHGLNPTTLAHEITHGLTSEVVDAAAQGKITNTEVLKAIDEQNAWMNVFGTEVGRLAKGDKTLEIMLNYGQTNVKEFMAVAASDPRVQNVMKSIKVGDVSLWQKFVGSVRKILGLRPKDEVMLDRVLDLTHQIASYDPKAKESQALMKIPGLETVEPNFSRAGLPDVPERIKAVAKSALSSGGAVKEVSLAKERQKGSQAATVLKSEGIGRRLQAERSKLNDKDITTAIEGGANAKAAFEKIKSASPAAAKAIEDFATSRRQASIDIIREKAKDPNLTPSEISMLSTIADRATNYLTRFYEANVVKGSMERKTDLARKAEAKAPGDRTPQEQEALKQYNDVVQFVKQRMLATPAEMAKMSTGVLEDVYKAHTGLIFEQQYKGLEGKERKTKLIEDITRAVEGIQDQDVAIRQFVDDVSGLDKAKARPAARYFRGLREGSNVLAEREVVPEEVRTWWGEVKDPVARMVQTMINQSSNLTQIRVLNEVREAGLGKFLKEGRGNEGFDHQLTGENLGALKGLYTNEYGKAAIDSFLQANAAFGTFGDAIRSTDPGTIGKWLGGKTLDVVRNVAGKVKATTILTNPGAYALNAAGSVYQTVSNGNYDTRTYSKGVSTVAKSIRAGKRKAAEDPDVQDGFKYGLFEPSQFSEIYHGPNASLVQKLLNDAIESQNPQEVIQKGIRKLKGSTASVTNTVKELYGAMDLWSKFANYYHELDYWKKYYGDTKPLDEIKQEVANRINDTNITPSRAPALLKGTESLGVTMFAPYFYEVIRTSLNNFDYGMSDVAKGFKEGNPGLVKHGASRLLGVASAMAGANYASMAAVKAVAGALGFTASELSMDDERRKYLEGSDFNSGQEPLLLKDGEGKEYTFDVGRLNPLDPMARPVKHLLEGIATGDKSRLELAKKDLLDLYFANSMWLKGKKILQGSNPPSRSQDEKAYNQMVEDLTAKGFSVTGANRMITGAETALGRGGFELLRAAVTDSKLSGKNMVGTQELDVSRDINRFLGPKFNTEVQAAKKPYLDLLKADINVSPERVERDFKQALTDISKPYIKLQQAVQAARAQGKSDKQIVASMADAKISKDAVAMLITGRGVPVKLILGDLSQDIKSDISGSKEPDKDMARARKNLTTLRDLIVKYKDTTVEELMANGR